MALVSSLPSRWREKVLRESIKDFMWSDTKCEQGWPRLSFTAVLHVGGIPQARVQGGVSSEAEQSSEGIICKAGPPRASVWVSSAKLSGGSESDT